MIFTLTVATFRADPVEYSLVRGERKAVVCEKMTF